MSLATAECLNIGSDDFTAFLQRGSFFVDGLQMNGYRSQGVPGAACNGTRRWWVGCCERKDAAVLVGTPGICPQAAERRAFFAWSSSLSFMSTLCNHLFLVFQALEALALTEEDRGPQQVDVFILEVEEDGGGGR